jgi:Flp pilus assembly pilin Flp
MRVSTLVRRLHADERGAEGLEKILIIAAIVLPLLGLLIIFRDAVKDWVGRVWTETIDLEARSHPEYVGPGVPGGGSG